MSKTLRVAALFVLFGATIVLASCGLNPFSGGSGPAATPGSKNATSGASASAGASSTATTSSSPTKFAPSPAPATFDPLLARGHWGYHSKKTVENKLSSGVTPALHENLEQEEIDDLTTQQSDSLLDIFRDSSRVHSWIDKAGGDSSDATYSVEAIQASDDVGNDTPWVYATLRAGFPTHDGAKVIQCFVYRQKTSKGLDLRPFVSDAIVGYVASDGTIPNPVRVKIR